MRISASFCGIRADRLGISLFLIALLALTYHLGSSAQTPMGAIIGSIEDANGGRLPGATIIVVNENTGQRWQATSSSEGEFRLINTPFGKYRIEVTAHGFAKKNISDLALESTTPVSLKIVMSLTGVDEIVNIASDVVSLQTENATQSATLTSSQIASLPTASRNYTHLIVTEPGISAPLPDRTGAGLNIATTPGTQSDDATQSLNPSVNGARPTSNAVRINGIDATNLLNRNGSLGNNINVPLDALETIETQTALYSAATGRNSGANLEMVIKSGSNNFHGSLYHFLQNEKFNANEFFNNRSGIERPKFRRNESGVTVSGPVWRNRTTFFAAVQRTDFVSGYATNATARAGLPTTLTDTRTPESIAQVANEWIRSGVEDNAQFAANFLAALRRFPADQVPGLIRQFFENEQTLKFRTLTAADIHPVAINILNVKRDGRFLIPSPTSNLAVLKGNGTLGREYELAQVIPTTFKSWSGVGSLQHQLNAKNRARLSYVQSSQNVEEAFGWADASPSPTLGSTSGFTAALSDEHTFSSNLINEFRAGFFDLQNTRISKFREIKNSTLGIFNPLEPALGGLAALMPTIDVVTQRNSGGIGNAWDFFDRQKVWNMTDTVNWIRSNHTIQFGGEYRRINLTGEFMSRTNGDLDYDNWALFFTGHGAAGGGSDLDQGDTRRNLNAQDYSLFIQDNWKLRRHLTLNIGLRYDFFGNFTDTDGRIGNYYLPETARRLGVEPGFQVPANSVFFQPNFNPLSVGLVIDPSVKIDLSQIHKAMNASTLTSDHNNFAPRIGLAWQLNDKTVLRAGYSLFYERSAASYKVDLQRTAPFFFYQNVPAPPDMANPYPRLNINPFVLPLNIQIARDANGAPRWVREDGTNFPAQSPFSAKSFTFIDPFVRTPQVHQWSMNVQHSFRKDIVLDTRYVGSSGVRLIGRINLAQPQDPRLVPVNGFNDVRDRRNNLINPDFFVEPQFLGLSRSAGYQLISNFGHSTYHALQLGFKGRLMSRANWNLAYTWSKSIDNFSADTQLADHDSRNIDHNRGVANFDRTHRFTAAFVYDLPTLFDGNAFRRNLTGGWRVSGLLTMQSGAPFSIFGSGTANAIFVQPSTPRLELAPGRTIESARRSGRIQDRLDNYFDVTAFQNSQDRFGNSGRNILRGPRQSQLDFTLGKLTKIRDRANLEFRWELYNLFNQPVFANPSSTYPASGTGSAGRITSTIGGPRTMQAALRLIF